MKGGTISLSWGRYGGFYASRYKSTRLAHGRRYGRVCLGWFALTWVPIEIDDLMAAYVDRPESL